MTARTSISPIPSGYHTVSPYLIVRGAEAAIEFYKRAFGAVELMRLTYPDGRLGHAELRIGDSIIMLADEAPEMAFHSPLQLGGSPVSMLLYVEDADAVVAQAEAAGATVVRPVQDQFYGDRSGMVQDPYGHAWGVASRIEDISIEEVQQRFNELLSQTDS